jgi:hypothetical protein
MINDTSSQTRVRSSNTSRLPGEAGPEIDEDALRLERYSILMSFDSPDEIPVLNLANQWSTSQQHVMGMKAGALRMNPRGPLAKLLDEKGFTQDVRPTWFGMNYVEPQEKELKKDESKLSKDSTGLDGDKTDTQKLYIPITTVTKGKGFPSGQHKVEHPKVTENNQTQHPATTFHPNASTTISEEQQRILAQHGIQYNATHGKWTKTVRQGKGFYSEHVDPLVELRKINQERDQKFYTESIADAALSNLSITTQALLKKVALNPSVFQCYQYVSNVRDPDTGAVLFNGDFGDYVSWCVLWTTDKFYGVQPSYIIDRPSEYLRLKEIRKLQQQRQLLPNSGENNPFNNLPVPGQNHYPGSYPAIPSHLIPKNREELKN